MKIGSRRSSEPAPKRAVDLGVVPLPCGGVEEKDGDKIAFHIVYQFKAPADGTDAKPGFVAAHWLVPEHDDPNLFITFKLVMLDLPNGYSHQLSVPCLTNACTVQKGDVLTRPIRTKDQKETK